MKHFSAVVVVLALPMALHAGYKEDVGYTQLSNELGGALPTGAGVSVVQVEALDGSNYRPDPANNHFTLTTFVWESGGSTAASNHATNVGKYFYGQYLSLSPGAQTVHSYEADDWLGDGFLNTSQFDLQGTPVVPDEAPARILNHSWIDDSTPDVLQSERLKRIDYAADHQDLLVVAGLNNGTGAVPKLLASAYNVVSVGRTDGNHSRGGASFEGDPGDPPRLKPDLVAPIALTSYTTPLVAGAGDMLYGHASAGSNGRKPQTLKAILMAGATKEEFAGWSQTATSPLDSIYGAGELNVYNSYHILDSGEQTTEVVVPSNGWDFAGAPGLAEQRIYYFEVPAGQAMSDLSAVLTWHRVLTTGFYRFDATLADLQLQLYTRSGSSLGTVLRTSNSPVDNVEHIWEPEILTPGEYALVVSIADGTDTADYGLAWRSTLGYPATYEVWKEVTFAGTSVPEEDRVRSADADDDGDSNLLEYATGSDATDPARKARVEKLNSGESGLVYARRKSATDLAYTVALSTNLVEWDYTEDDLEEVSVTDLGNDLEEVTVRLTAPLAGMGAKVFLHLCVACD